MKSEYPQITIILRKIIQVHYTKLLLHNEHIDIYLLQKSHAISWEDVTCHMKTQYIQILSFQFLQQTYMDT